MDEGSGTLEGTIVEIHGMWATVLSHTSGARIRSRLQRRRQVPAIGDRVIVDPTGDKPRIAETAPRERSLWRPKTHGASIMATHVDRLIIMVAVEPRVKFGLVDRLLVAAHAEDIDTVLVLNKSDLSGFEALSDRFAPYRALGYDVIGASALTGAGIEALEALVSDGLSVFIGHSGVGKSTMLNRLIPGAELATNPLSRATGKGRHTTSVSTSHPVGDAWPEGGLVIDTPGIRTFGLHRIPVEDLGRYYPEFGPFLDGCHFRNCAHLNEPKCGVREAVDRGDVLKERYTRYRGILESVKAGEG